MNSKFRAFLVLTVIVLLLPATAAAKPTYQQARAIYDQLKQPFFDTGMFHKKAFKERLVYIDTAKAFRDKTEKMFGVPSSCFSAASMRFEYVTALHEFANRLEGRINSQLDWMGVTNPMYTAFVYGESTAACYNDVEALDNKK